MRLIITHTTLLKLRPVDSSSLTESQKINLVVGSRLIIANYEDQDQDHYRITLLTSLGSGQDKSMVWYVYKPHALIIPSDREFATVNLSTNSKLNVRSSPAVASNNVIYQIPNQIDVELIECCYNQELWWLGKPLNDPNKAYGWISAKYLKLYTSEGCSG
ncbi:conserved hypothetical protein [Planktothrix serta PCC 8927]|uniref:Uncharacterized protein n=1 Tax=Planktothrix serta PCC 8927 TaxID=671068 RepID=A0A7Z9C3R9_9CYAN|nr:SH3 domain-containing protein [Planktothrix serta]VXD25295.1 conserved hypothetical protein [Planktothrix serta PCC 8927]